LLSLHRPAIVKSSAEFADLLASDADTCGFRGKVWTSQRVAEVVFRQSGVRHYPAT
jgi:hypothetical protein